MPSALGRQSTVVFGGIAAGILIGVVVQAFVAAELGTSATADVFYLGNAIPTLIATATLGTSTNALIRYATDYPATLDPRNSGSTGRALMILALILSGVVALAGTALCTGLVDYRTPESGAALGNFVLITAPVPALIALAALASVLALAERQFLRAAWGGVANGFGLLAVMLMLAHDGLSASDLAVAVLCGYVCQLAFVGPALRATRSSELGDTELRALTASATKGLLLLLGAAMVYKSQPFVERLVGTTVGVGVPAALGYTDKITSALTQLAAFGFAFAALPSLSRDLAASDHDGAAARLEATLIGTLISTSVVVAFALSSSREIVHVLYARGEFTDESAVLTRTLMIYAMPSVILGALAGPLVGLGYANKRVTQVVRIGLAGFVVGSAMSVALGNRLGAEGVVLGTATGFGLTFVLFARSVRDSLPDWAWGDIARRQGTLVLAVTVALLVAIPVVQFIPVPAESVAALLALGVRFGLLAATGFGLMLWLGRRSGPSADDGPVLAEAGVGRDGEQAAEVRR